MTAASPLRGPKSMEGGGFAAAHLRAPRRLRGRSSGLKGASRFLRKWPAATLDPGDLGGPWGRKSGQARACPGQARGAQAPRRGGRLRIPGRQEQSELAFDNQKRKGKITQIQVRAPGPVASSQQSHLAKLRHTKPGVHETRDTPM